MAKFTLLKPLKPKTLAILVSCCSLAILAWLFLQKPIPNYDGPPYKYFIAHHPKQAALLGIAALLPILLSVYGKSNSEISKLWGLSNTGKLSKNYGFSVILEITGFTAVIIGVYQGYKYQDSMLAGRPLGLVGLGIALIILGLMIPRFNRGTFGRITSNRDVGKVLMRLGALSFCGEIIFILMLKNMGQFRPPESTVWKLGTIISFVTAVLFFGGLVIYMRSKSQPLRKIS